MFGIDDLILGGLSQIFGGAGKSRAEAQALNERNQVGLYGEQNADDYRRAMEQLARDKFGLEAPKARMGNAVTASLAKNYQPVGFEWGGPGAVARGGAMPHFTGGLSNPAVMNDPEVKQLSDNMLHSSLIDQLRGGSAGGHYTGPLGGVEQGFDFGGGADTRSAFPERRQPPQVGESSGLDDFLGYAGLGTGIMSQLGRLLKKKVQPGGGEWMPQEAD